MDTWGEPKSDPRADIERVKEEIRKLLTFRKYAEEWYKDTRTTSSLRKMVTHPAYLRIIALGPEAVPLLLRELERTRDHWLWALNAITGKDPAPERASFDEAVDAWLAWGREHGYL